MKRNVVVLAGLLAASGDTDSARQWLAVAKKETRELTIATARMPHFGDQAAGKRFRVLLKEVGL